MQFVFTELVHQRGCLTDSSAGERAAAELGKPNVVPVQLDVADDESVRSAAAWVADELGRCDFLINNAAIEYDTDLDDDAPG